MSPRLAQRCLRGSHGAFRRIHCGLRRVKACGCIVLGLFAHNPLLRQSHCAACIGLLMRQIGLSLGQRRLGGSQLRFGVYRCAAGFPAILLLGLYAF